MIQDVRTYKGQQYKCLAVASYLRKDGTAGQMASWETNCSCCGLSFECKAPWDGAKFAPSRRCYDCRQPGLPVTAEELAEAEAIVRARAVRAEQRRQAEEAR